MPRSTPPRFRKTLLALAASAALTPYSAWALDLAQSPPGTVEPYVRPNVIISIDDSGSMGFRLDTESANNATNNTEPNAVTKSWPVTSRRMNVLKYSLKSIFDPTHPNYDSSLLPDGKIRLAWQAMWNNGNSISKYNDLNYWYGGSTANPGKGKTPGAGDVSTPVSGSKNQMRVLDATHRANFIEFASYLLPQNGTPSHEIFSQADAYMRQTLNTNSAWASKPGTTGAPFLGCRRTYHIMMTDGRWNSTPGTFPNTNKRDNATNLTLPDGMVFGGATVAERTKTALYRDSSSTTLADWAFYSWGNPLQTSGLTGTMQPAADYRKAPATETFTNASGSSVTLDRYWNPRYNPATWPHMVTYTIGFSKMAFEWDYASIKRPTEMVPFGYDGSFPDLAKDTAVKWPNLTASTDEYNSLDLWHAALNGRGRFYAVEKGEDLEKAFREIFAQINATTDPDLSASATSGSNASRSSVGKYTAGYEPMNFWKGFVRADTVTSDGTTSPAPGWEGKNTAEKLDTLSSVSSRLVLSWSDKWVNTQPKGGVPFKWATDETNLSTPQKLWLQKNTAGTDEGATKGQERLEYVRGERGKEGVDPTGYTSTSPYRQRKSRQGDIINSDVWYSGAPAGDSLLKGYAAFVRDNKTRPGMLYVGGNDGMLHGFAAADGQEKIAYVPRGAIPSLTRLTAPAYNNKHEYFVDGTPMTGDVDLNGGMQDPKAEGYDGYIPNWRTLLVGTLGAGGKGYFVLDVTNPTATALPNGTPGLTEANAAQLVKLDRTRGVTEPTPGCAAMPSGAEKTACLLAVDEDKDIGHITAKPVTDDNDDMRSTQITRMNNNRWAVVLGNGYNSANQRPVLLLQYLDGNRELLRLQTTTDTPGSGKANDNGLGAPRVVDLNGDGRIDIAYAGDNQGNLWKFDLTSATASNWGVAFSGAPLFTASGPAALGATTRPKVQPISTPPTVRANDRMKTVGSGTSAKTVRVGGMMVAFGTGRNTTKTDPESVDVQTLYSVLDNTRYREVGTGAAKRLEVHPGGGSCPSGDNCVPEPAALGAGVTAAKLARQTVQELDSGEFGAIQPATTAEELKLGTWANFNGWYLDLPAVGERLLKGMKFYDSSNLLTAYSQVPAKGSDVDPNIESCESISVDEERQYRNFVNIMDGKAPSVAVVDKNNDGKFNMADGDGVQVNGKYISISRKKVEKGPHVIISTGNKDENVGITAKNNKEKLARLPEESLRPSWRQLQ